MSKIYEDRSKTVRLHDFGEEFGASQKPEESLTLRDIRRVKLEVSAELGNASMLVREVLELKEGSILPLSKAAGEMADIFINGIPFARGEIVVLVDSLHVRISEISGLLERDNGEGA
jgi:flagellar motor switch protein FliN/FliY